MGVGSELGLVTLPFLFLVFLSSGFGVGFVLPSSTYKMNKKILIQEEMQTSLDFI
jgi:hypothetical protein